MATVRGDDLHIFFKDGSHRRLSPPGAPLATIVTPLQTAELTLPGRALPRAIAADEVHDVLYALITARQAAKIEPPVDDGKDYGDTPPDGAAATSPTVELPGASTDTSGTGATAEDGDDAATDRLEEHPAMQAGSDLAFARYAGGRWMRDRNAPADLTLKSTVGALLASDGVIHIVYMTEPDAPSSLHRVSTARDAPWSEATVVPFPAAATPLAGGWRNSTPVLLIAEDRPLGIAVHPLRFLDDTWERAPRLLGDGHEPMTLSEPYAASLFDGRAAVAAADEQGTVQIGLWSPDTGAQLESLTPVTALTQRRDPQLDRLVRTVIPWVVLIALLSFIFVWRRESVLLTVSLGAGQTFARLQHRAAALFIDLTILAPVWGPAIYALWRTDADGLSAMEQLMSTGGRPPPEMLWSPAIVGAILGLYALVFEFASGATPGKRIMGCSVVRRDGKPCGAGAILVRNAVRIIEFHFAAVALLVLLTPSRQRLGDILARTVVVETVPAPPPPKEPDGDEEG